MLSSPVSGAVLVLPTGVYAIFSGNASRAGPHENPMKLDAEPEVSFHEVERDEPLPVAGLGRNIDKPGDADEDCWKNAENANPCEREADSSGGGSATVSASVGLGAE